jgi:hypothetical protein
MSPSRPRIAALTVFLATLAVAAAATVAVSPASARDGQTHAGQSQAQSAAGSAQRASGVEVMLKMNGKKTKKKVPGVKGLRNSGSAKVRVGVATRDGGYLKLVRAQRKGKAIRFPEFRARTTAPKAQIRVVSANKSNPLNPGNRDFTFGADFRLDSGTTETKAEDDGDNLIQRGQFQSATQYKIQLDKSIPNCRIKGTAGAVEVKSDLGVSLPRNRWHRVRCYRVGDDVTLKVWRLSKRGAPKLVVNETNPDDDPTVVRIGSVTAPRGRGLAIGGRLTNRNVVPRGHADQFNGIIDSVMFDRL